jgi:uncharacterized cupin superfamily protein
MNKILRGGEAELYATLFADPAIGLRYGVASTGGRCIREQTSGAHRMVVVQAGNATIEGADGVGYELSPGEAVVLPAASRWRWTQTATTRYFDIHLDTRDDGNVGTRPVVIRPREIHNLEASPPPAAELLVGPTPVQGNKRLFADSTGQWKAGVWSSSPYYRKTMPFPKHEFMYLLSGWLELTTEDGKLERFEANDVVFIPKGTVCDWRTQGMSKIYCIFEPKAAA